MIRSTRCDVRRGRRGAGLRGRWVAGALSAAALLVVSSIARAQPAGRDPAAAEALFREGRDRVKAGDYAGGCPKFEVALALHPTASVMLNIAKCHEHKGKIATAWAEYGRARVLNRETPEAARQRALDEIAVEGMRALEPRLPKLTIRVVRAPAGLVVTRDGVAVPASALGAALPADPGGHEVRASAPGYRAETRAVTLEEGQQAMVEISLEREGKAAIAPGGEERRGGVPAWVWVTGGAGVAIAGAGVYFLAEDLSAISALQEHCRTDAAGTRCDPGYDFERDNARKNRSLGLFVGLGGAGVVALGIATVGLIKALPAREVERGAAVTASPWIGPGGAGATLSWRL